MEKDSTPPINVELGQVASSCACFNLRKASRVVTQHFDAILQPSGVSITQFTVLVEIAMAQAVTIHELAEVLVMDRTTLTRNLKPLEREGWVKIEHGQDRRIRVVSLATDGEAVLAKALPLWRQAQGSVVETLGSQRWSALLSNLTEATELIR
jgi:DNA-binding MarR family transcriptional regulator